MALRRRRHSAPLQGRAVPPAAPRRVRAAVYFALLLLAAPAGLLHAGDVLTMLPTDLPVVICIRDADTTQRQINALVARIDKTRPGRHDLLDQPLIGAVGRDAIHAEQPLYLIYTESQFGGPPNVAAFTPNDPAAFYEQTSGKDHRIRTVHNDRGKYYLMMRDGIAFVSDHRRPLRQVRRLPKQRSLVESFDGPQRDLFKTSDVTVYVAMAPWREQLRARVLLGTNLMKVGMLANQTPEDIDKTSKVFDWILEGVNTVVSDMETVTFALDLDGEAVRFTHHHTFPADSPVARYLGHVRRAGDVVGDVPFRPFFIFGALSWCCEPEQSLGLRMTKLIYALPEIEKNATKEKRDTILERSLRLNTCQTGQYFMFATRNDASLPLTFHGGYRFSGDPIQAFDDYLYIQQNACEIMQMFMPGGGCNAELRKHPIDGVTVHEMRFDLADMNPMMQAQFNMMYGPGAGLQQVLLKDKHAVVYTMAPAPAAAADLARQIRRGDTLDHNPAVQALRKRLPPDENLLLLLDLQRLIGLMPELIRQSAAAQGASIAPPAEPPVNAARAPNADPGPLLGYAGYAHDRAYTGVAAIGTDDLAAAADQARRMAAGLYQDR